MHAVLENPQSSFAAETTAAKRFMPSRRDS